MAPPRSSKRTKPPKANTSSPQEAEDIEDFSFSTDEVLEIRSSLLQWYDANRRILPWRQRPPDEDEECRAYAVWVSEVMLQQTRVPTVVAYFNRWMDRWPTLPDLSLASQEEVNEVWAGLGYYRRARFLLEGAKAIAQQGGFPRTASALRAVPGIGGYTAGAIASIAFSEVAPVVDGNVVRVISRLRAISANPKESASVKLFWKLAGQLVDPSRPGDFNQAIMELGATLCSTSSPGCSLCPISNHCRAFLLSRKSGTAKVTDYPTKVAKAKQRHDYAAVSVVEIAEGTDPELFKAGKKKNMLLIVKRPEEGLLAGLWEFPSILVDEEKVDQSTRRKAIDKLLKKSFKIDVQKDCNVMVREDVGEYLHVFSHIRLRMYVELLVLNLKGGLSGLQNNAKSSTLTWKYVDDDSIRGMGLTSGVRKVYNMVQNFKENQLPEHSEKVPKKRIKR